MPRIEEASPEDFWSNNPCGVDGHFDEVSTQRYVLEPYLPGHLKEISSKVSNSDKFLEIGIGQGTDALYMCSLFHPTVTYIGIDYSDIKISQLKSIEEWEATMTGVLTDLRRIVKPGGHIAFEVGEVRGGKVLLEENVVRCGVMAGLEPVVILINDQEFTKTANAWGVDNSKKGTNTNRIVVFNNKTTDK